MHRDIPKARVPATAVLNYKALLTTAKSLGDPLCTPEVKPCQAEAGHFFRCSLANRGMLFSGIQACRNESKTNSCMKMDLEKALKRFASDSCSDYDLHIVHIIF